MSNSAKTTGLLTSQRHVVLILGLAVATLRPGRARLVLIGAVFAATNPTSLGTVDVHVLWVLLALPRVGPILAVHIVVLTAHLTLFTGNWAVHQHPGRVLATLVVLRPSGTVLVLVDTLWLHPGLRCGGGRLCAGRSTATAGLGITSALVECVELPNICI